VAHEPAISATMPSSAVAAAPTPRTGNTQPHLVTSASTAPGQT
jgi:hypothetical protein